MAQFRDYSPDEMISISIRVNAQFAAAIHEIASRTPGQSTAAWLEATLRPIVAKGLGVTLASLERPKAIVGTPVRLLAGGSASASARIQALVLDTEESVKRREAAIAELDQRRAELDAANAAEQARLDALRAKVTPIRPPTPKHTTKRRAKSRRR